MDKVQLTTYRDIPVYITQQGFFSAKPDAAKKERVADSLLGLQHQLDEYFKQQAVVKRESCDVPFYRYDEDKGKVSYCTYLGTRGRATATHDEGHAFKDADVYFTIEGYRHQKLLVIPALVNSRERAQLEDAADAVAKAKQHLKELIAVYCVDVQLPSLGYKPDVEQLNDIQAAAVNRIREAQSKQNR